MTFLSHFGRHTILWLFCHILDNILTYDFLVTDFGRHTNLWLFVTFWTTSFPNLWLFGLCNDWWHNILYLWLVTFWNDILEIVLFMSHFRPHAVNYDLFSHILERHTKPTTFLWHFGRHTNLWLFCHILDDILYLWLFGHILDDILNYDFFVTFWTTY